MGRGGRVKGQEAEEGERIGRGRQGSTWIFVQGREFLVALMFVMALAADQSPKLHEIYTTESK